MRVIRRATLAAIVAGAAIVFWWLQPASGNLVAYIWWDVTSGRHATERYIRVGDEYLYAEILGEGPPVLLLPGGLSTVDSFFSQLPVLAKDFRVIALEPRGHGRSHPITALTYELLANDAIAVLDALNVSQVSVVGWSDGGTTGLMMALEHPERVDRLVAIGANFSPAGIDAAEQRKLLADEPADHGWLARMVYRWRAGANADWPALSRVVTTLWRTRPVADLRELRRVSAPTLLIVGGHDLVTLDHVREMADQVPNAVLSVIEDGGHTSLIWHASQVNEQIVDFLRVQGR